MSGLEIAGLVLGAFPLILKAISGYADGCRKVEAMYGYSEELVCFHLELKTEYEKFQGVCDHLLRDVVDPSVIDNLLQPESEESGKSDWKTHILENVLQEKYRKTAVPVIMQNMKRLLDALQSLKEMFPVNPSSKKPFAPKYIKRFYRAINFAVLESDRTQKMLKIRQINDDLRDLILDWGRPSANGIGKTRIAAKAISTYQKVQKQAAELCKIVKEKLDASGCKCEEAHSVTLRLDVRDLYGAKTCYESGFFDEFQSPIKFRTFISINEEKLGKTWRGIDFELHDEEDDRQRSCNFAKSEFKVVAGDKGVYTSKYGDIGRPAQLPRAQPLEKRKPSPEDGTTKWVRFNFFSINMSPAPSLSEPSTPHVTEDQPVHPKHSCIPNPPILSSLCSVCTGPHPEFYYLCPTKYHRILPSSSPACTKNTNLAHLLTQPTFSRKRRLQLAVKLASSVLQLYSTGWLSESWSAEDVEFLEDRNGKILGAVTNLNQAQGRTSDEAGEDTYRYHAENRTMFSLGIVLIELMFRKPLDECPQRPNEFMAMGKLGDQLRRREHALRLLDLLGEEAGQGYEDAVRRCVKGFDIREDKLEQPAFRRAVYDGILVPLKKTLQEFMGS